jgi:hypothetical protein
MPKDYALAVTPANEQRRFPNVMGDEWVKDFLPGWPAKTSDRSPTGN